MFLTEREIRELTEYQRPADQRRWLDRNGVPYYVGARGRPKVLRKSLEPNRQSLRIEPDFSQLARKG